MIQVIKKTKRRASDRAVYVQVRDVAGKKKSRALTVEGLSPSQAKRLILNAFRSQSTSGTDSIGVQGCTTESNVN